MQELLWLLLPVAAWSGWFAASRTGAGRDRRRGGLRPDYFKGINHLINEQPDRAIEAFIEVLEVDGDTAETHLALGNLYRRRGEVDRAIRIHQNLITRHHADDERRDEALLELAQDYLSAGLLDRAEDLFRELADADRFRVQALRQLIDIYEQEKDWHKAIGAARQLENVTGTQLGSVIAHYWCEVAELARQGDNAEQALQAVRQALSTHRSCARASLLEGDLLRDADRHEEAIVAYRRVEQQDPQYLPEVIERLRRSAEALGQREQLIDYLGQVMREHGGITVTLALAELMEAEMGRDEAAAFMTEQLRVRPTVRGFRRLTELQLAAGAADGNGAQLQVLRDLSVQLLRDRPVYKCEHCGFPARSLHWQCPGCKHWNTVKPIQGVEGE